MSNSSRRAAAARLLKSAALFAALGDGTRLEIVAKLADGSQQSITQLTAGADVTRQAITKHLHVLETAGIVQSTKRGRETLFALQPRSLEEAQRALAAIAVQWDAALGRLKTFVEE
ncbi:ArsR/SmtB family transcription factor [Lacipirellula limnantheis]|uniref:HTH-type transcriptional regulator n=1 Tax=Lacipirellula limnantheis TaxID=2528024 RepID=A0A517TSS6_9BACT|nr:metalloregulator ArsR/SmtB family transcription factor [Lacipirellula limnantheis]QDT71419.1 HTH-type transcriptional regulator [Lacipirellula limnantheis]